MSLNVKAVCQKCLGTGVYQRTTGPVDPCPGCNGGGEIDIPELIEDTAVMAAIAGVATQCNDILDKCNDILDKCNDIFEKVNT